MSPVLTFGVTFRFAAACFRHMCDKLSRDTHLSRETRHLVRSLGMSDSLKVYSIH